MGLFGRKNKGGGASSRAAKKSCKRPKKRDECDADIPSPSCSSRPTSRRCDSQCCRDQQKPSFADLLDEFRELADPSAKLEQGCNCSRMRSRSQVKDDGEVGPRASSMGDDQTAEAKEGDSIAEIPTERDERRPPEEHAHWSDPVPDARSPPRDVSPEPFGSFNPQPQSSYGFAPNEYNQGYVFNSAEEEAYWRYAAGSPPRGSIGAAPPEMMFGYPPAGPDSPYGFPRLSDYDSVTATPGPWVSGRRAPDSPWLPPQTPDVRLMSRRLTIGAQPPWLLEPQYPPPPPPPPPQPQPTSSGRQSGTYAVRDGRIIFTPPLDVSLIMGEVEPPGPLESPSPPSAPSSAPSPSPSSAPSPGQPRTPPPSPASSPLPTSSPLAASSPLPASPPSQQNPKASPNLRNAQSNIETGSPEGSHNFWPYDSLPGSPR